jgi:hypothetical protein
MALIKATNPRAEVTQLERTLQQIDIQLGTLNKERKRTSERLEQLRRSLTICPKCGRDEDFLTDEGGVLIHVLEDAQDTDLLSANKPLYGPDCGEVFLYQPAPLGRPALRAVPRARLA